MQRRTYIVRPIGKSLTIHAAYLQYANYSPPTDTHSHLLLINRCKHFDDAMRCNIYKQTSDIFIMVQISYHVMAKDRFGSEVR